MGCVILRLDDEDGSKIDVVTAFAEPACGPGWANQPVWVICRNHDGSLYMECIQPEEQTREMRLMYSLSADIHQKMRREAEQIL